jgi:hypothetical protein
MLEECGIPGGIAWKVITALLLSVAAVAASEVVVAAVVPDPVRGLLLNRSDCSTANSRR